MKKQRKILNLLLVVLFVCSLSVTVLAETWWYAPNVPLVQQAKTQWCWAACAEMAAKNAYSQTNRTQWDGVLKVKGSQYPNLPATSVELCNAAEYICYYNADFRVNHYKWSMNNIRNEVKSLGKPLTTLAGYYNNSGQRTGGHFTVIEAVYNASDWLRYNDPWDSTQHWVSYSAFCNGSYNGRIYEETIYAR